MRAERRPMLPTAVRHASHAHAAQHDARHEAAHMVSGWCPRSGDQVESTRGRGSNSKPRRRIWGWGTRVVEGKGKGRSRRRIRQRFCLFSRDGRRAGGVGPLDWTGYRRPSRLHYFLRPSVLWTHFASSTGRPAFI
jgi:hypothetical protein